MSHMLTLSAQASEFDIVGNNDLRLGECNELRARGRHPEEKDAECIVDFNFDQLPLINTGFANAKEIVSGKMVPGINYCIPNTSDEVVGAACLQTKSSTSQLAFQPDQLNPEEFSLEGWVRFPNVNYGGGSRYVWGEWAGTNGANRWFVRFFTKTFDVVTADTDGNSNSFTCAVSGIANNTWYRFQFTYKESTATATFELKDVAGNSMGTSSSNTAKVMPSPGINDHPGLHIGRKFDGGTGVFQVSTWIDMLIDDTQLYTKALDSFVVPSDTQKIFATGQAGDLCEPATITLDRGSVGSLWDMSSLTVDDEDQWISDVADHGWTLSFEVSDNPTPGTYSLYMKLAAFRSLSDLSGRYMHLRIKSEDSTGVVFHPFAWLAINASLGAAEILPPAFDGIENDGDGDAVTLTITPPAAGSYDATRIYYRIFGSGSAWTDAGTYVGAQGVQGTKQITGLTNDTRYQFIIFSEEIPIYSVPTPTRSIYCTDNADEGDYINTEKKIVVTLQADTGDGGLNETGDPMVKLIERGVKDAPNDYGKYELPAIGVYVTAKREIQDENEETIEKDFDILFAIVARVGKIPEGEDIIKKIMARLETVVREQTSTGNLWTQLPVSDLIKGAEGTLATILTESTSPVVSEDKNIAQGDFVLWAMVMAEIQIPVSFDL